MSSNTELSQAEGREQVLDVLRRRGVSDHLEDQDDEDQTAIVDTLAENYSLATLNKDTEVQAEIDALDRRIRLLGDRTPEHVSTLRAERDALEAVKGGRRVKNWGGVRRQVE